MRALRRDANEPGIIPGLKEVGATVDRAQGKPYDLVVGYRGVNHLLEVKTEKGELTDSQRKFKRDWRGHYAIVRNLDEALIAIGFFQPMRTI